MHFLSLPGEIRDLVYFHALTPVQIESPPDGSRSPYPTRHHVPGASVLRVNKQVHEEAAAVLYGSINYQFIAGTSEFLNIIGPINASKIRHLIIHHRALQTWVLKPRFQTTKQAEHLEKASATMQLIAETCTGLVTLKIYGTRAAWFTDSRDIWGNSTARFDEIDRDLVKKLPVLKPLVLQIRGKEEHLASPECAPVVARANELGWEVCHQPERTARKCTPRRLNRLSRPVEDRLPSEG